jgi:hypothetical protein
MSGIERERFCLETRTSQALLISSGTGWEQALAEGEGFEPSIRFPVYTLSKRAPSAARPPLRTRIRAHYSPGGEADNSRSRCGQCKMSPPGGEPTPQDPIDHAGEPRHDSWHVKARTQEAAALKQPRPDPDRQTPGACSRDRFVVSVCIRSQEAVAWPQPRRASPAGRGSARQAPSFDALVRRACCVCY